MSKVYCFEADSDIACVQTCDFSVLNRVLSKKGCLYVFYTPFFS